MLVNLPVGDAAIVVTLSDTNAVDPKGPFGFLYIGVAGNIKFTDAAGNVVGPTAVAAGGFPFRVVNVWSTGTTATGILGGKTVP